MAVFSSRTLAEMTDNISCVYSYTQPDKPCHEFEPEFLASNALSSRGSSMLDILRAVFARRPATAPRGRCSEDVRVLESSLSDDYLQIALLLQVAANLAMMRSTVGERVCRHSDAARVPCLSDFWSGSHPRFTCVCRVLGCSIGVLLGTAVVESHRFPGACCYVTSGLEFGDSYYDGVPLLKFDSCELVLSPAVYTWDKVLPGGRPRGASSARHLPCVADQEDEQRS